MTGIYHTPTRPKSDMALGDTLLFGVLLLGLGAGAAVVTIAVLKNTTGGVWPWERS